MKKEKILWLAVVILVVLNISCLLVILLRKGERPNKKFDAMIIENLRLNENQIERFNGLKHNHRMQIGRLDRSMQGPFEQYFGLLKGNRDKIKEDSLENVLALLYQQKVELTYSHFADLKAICTPEQQQNMDKIVPFLMQVISPPKKEVHGRGK
ncbi:MAG: hypothetical protein H7Y13_01055 [Sphingobacteriaceae bacterium]|nr:hypothetical protein [Sphingobacteriaceae bacterium]